MSSYNQEYQTRQDLRWHKSVVNRSNIAAITIVEETKKNR